MLTKGAIEDLIAEHLFRGRSGGGSPAPKKVPELQHRVFLSDFELRAMITAGGRAIKVPANAIISPLALDWIEYNGIEIVRG
ncbi:MAG: hypothetical protein WCK76_07385 [Elusimicrobiota bacterium]